MKNFTLRICIFITILLASGLYLYKSLYPTASLLPPFTREKEQLFIECVDEETKKRNANDIGVRLEIYNVLNVYEAIIIEQGFNENIVFEAPVNKEGGYPNLMFKGENFEFNINSIDSTLKAKLTKSVHLLSSKEPVRELNIKMDCSFILTMR